MPHKGAHWGRNVTALYMYFVYTYVCIYKYFHHLKKDALKGAGMVLVWAALDAELELEQTARASEGGLCSAFTLKACHTLQFQPVFHKNVYTESLKLLIFCDYI